MLAQDSSRPDSDQNAAKVQLTLSLGFLVFLALAFLLTYSIVRSRNLEDLSGAVQERYWHAEGGRYAYHPLSLDTGDYLMQRVVPGLDLSEGGIVFLGSSTMQHALVNWKLPAEERSRVFNLAVESSSLREQGQWLKFLIDHHGLGKSKRERTVVVLGLYHGDARAKRRGTLDWDFIPKLFARYPEYSYQLEQGIHRHEEQDLAAQADSMRRLVRSGLLGLKEDFWRFGSSRISKGNAAVSSDAVKLRSDLQRSVGTLEWTSDGAQQVAELRNSVGLLRQHGIEVVGVLLPTREFSRELPLAKQFNEAVRKVFAEQDAKLFDLTQAAEESHFADGSHLNYIGQHLISQQVMTIAREAALQKAKAH